MISDWLTGRAAFSLPMLLVRGSQTIAVHGMPAKYPGEGVKATTSPAIPKAALPPAERVRPDLVINEDDDRGSPLREAGNYSSTES
ncbi:hypothetical protein ACIQPR_09465 [Streptomyces sp. NPDC091280]|uniref:hypothetical protein n=1 Tax=Streptomyces sp. NPDC091280 TaxID=3365984 RepID=UPI00380FF2FC